MIRIAAVGDIHLGVDSAGCFRGRLAHLGSQADLFLLAGDLTKRGTPEEAAVLGAELSGLPIPTFAVLGNHDYESDSAEGVVSELRAAGIRTLEGDSAICQLDTCSVGIAGVKGFGGGFAGRCGAAFGEPEMKAFMHHAQGAACRLETALTAVADADVCIALMHYSPIEETLEGEHCEIYPFLGCYLLAEAIDRSNAALALHGHAHAGSPSGATPGGTPVRNVAIPVIERSYQVFSLPEHA
ncbi:MAG TPA: metallophosphoesterase [Acidimicrobiales bacterium]|nr:metallophosphoesterase [Acidimicrobiales bacterium]